MFKYYGSIIYAAFCQIHDEMINSIVVKWFFTPLKFPYQEDLVIYLETLNFWGDLQSINSSWYL